MAEELKAIGRQLLAQATPKGSGLEPLATGLRGAGQRLEEILLPIIGASGYRMLMASALRRASSRHPFLKEVAVYEDGIDAGEVVARHNDSDYERLSRGFQDAVDSFVELVAQLIGESLATTLLRETLDRERRTESSGAGSGDNP